MNKKGYRSLTSGAKIDRWKDIGEELTSTHLTIEGRPVMERWETPYMEAFAQIVTSNGGRVLELGFGMGISATAIQSFNPDEHIIIEANKDVYKRLEAFSKASKNKVTPILGLATEMVKDIEDSSLDGVFYDTYPLNKEEQHEHQFKFIKQVYPKIKKGGILTYCNLTSAGVLRNDYGSWEELFEKFHKPRLITAGIPETDIQGIYIFNVSPYPECKYFQHNSAIIPIIKKG